MELRASEGCPERSLVGRNSLNIPDSRYTASSFYNYLYQPHNAKPDGRYGWAPKDNSNPNDYLQIDLGTERIITAVATQGNGGLDEWVTKYKLYFAKSDPTKHYRYRNELGKFKIFKGNKNHQSIVRHDLTNPQLARYIRFVPMEHHVFKTMRVNVYVTNQEQPCITVFPHKRSIQLRWTYKRCHPTDHITGYLVKVGNKTHTIIKDNLSYQWTNLKPFTEYNVSVKAIKKIGYGVWSNVTRIKTSIAVPEAIPIITDIKATSSETVLVEWKIVQTSLVHGPLEGYKITYTPRRGITKTVDVGVVTMYNLTSLLKYTNYSITVAVKNTKYVGAASKEQTVRTMEDAPSAPRNVSAKLTHSRGLSRPQVVITWNAPRYLNGIIRKYTIVYYYNMNTSNEKIVTINKTSDLQYIIDDTRKGILSYKISASTIQEGPYTTGTVNLTMLSFVKLKHNAKDVADKRTMLIAGLVVGFIVMVLLLVVGIALWKRNRNQKMKQQPPADPIHLNSIVDESSLEVLDNNLNEASNHFLEIEDKKYEDIESCTLAPDLMPVQNVAEFVPPDINKLTQEFETIPAESRYECKEAKKPANKIKNRYKNIVSYDHSLVTLEKIDNDTDSCYINASYIHGYDGTPEAYIATQGPLGNTLSDFWRMIWERNISSIVMLTNLLELGKRKCHQYWPDKSYQYSDITVTTHKTEVFADFVIRTFFISKDGTTNRRVLQFHFTAWPDKGVPDYATAVLAFRRKVLGMSSGSNSPMVIHCSAGVGRTGTYIIIDAMLRQAEKQQNIDIVSYLIAIRDDRPYMVQTLEQYIFVYTAVHEALNCGSTEVQVHNLRIAMQELSAVDKRHRISGYALEFQRLEAVTSQDSQGTFDVGLAKENVKKNRYSYIVAANESRVILSTNGDADKVDYVNISSVDTCRDHKGDYINASFVDTYRNRNAFIMTQAPMKNTIADFWRMVMDYEIGTIVMLNNLKEEYESFPQYWPDGTKTYDDVTVKLLETEDLGNVIYRLLRVSNHKANRTVCHFQHLNWENKCIPTGPQTVLNLLDEVQKSQQKSGNSPIVVLCNNGVGRSGTFCAIASTLERVKQEQVLDVFQTVKSIRVNRPGAVETLTQYVFCYNIIQKYLDSFSDYANFGDVK